MKQLIGILAFVMGLSLAPAMAEEAFFEPSDALFGATVKKDKEYWTRVWYQKQAKKKANRARSSRKSAYRSSSKRRSSKRRSTRRSGVVARVDLSSQRMHVYRNGVRQYTWKISSGRSGYGTPTGTWRIHRMHKRYFSKKYDNAPMPYAMFYHRGFAIHGTNSIKRLGRRASHGCVRLHPKNAAKLFSMVKRHGGTVRVTY